MRLQRSSPKDTINLHKQQVVQLKKDAAVGVAALTSATRSAIVVSVSCPTEEMTGI